MELRAFEASSVATKEDLMYEGFERLQEAVLSFSDTNENDVDIEETGKETVEESIAKFLESCLTPRQTEVMRLAGRGAIESDSTDARLWSKVKSSIIRHPAVVGGMVGIQEEAEQPEKKERPSIEIGNMLFSMMSEPEWKKEAACSGDTRFISPGNRSLEKKLSILEICEGCPVYDKCLEYVADKGPEASVWAGAYRAKEGRKKNKGSGYNEDGTPVTIQEERKNLQGRIKEKEAKKRARRKSK